MHTATFIPRLTVIGVGLIGGSLARALREAGAVGTITGVDADPRNLADALDLGIIDHAAPSLLSGVADADLVFVAAPPCSINSIVTELASGLKPGCIVTDAGSVKQGIVADCETAMPPGRYFVGGHPIAGTEHSGAGASFATLFNGRRCILTPTLLTDPGALEAVSRLWKAAGAEVCIMEPGHHDRIFAEISHLPHIIAYALVHAVGTADVEGENVLSYTAGGFRDFTRIASSDPAMWRDIALMNRTPLLKSLDGFSTSLARLRCSIQEGDAAAMAEFFTIAKQFRDGIL